MLLMMFDVHLTPCDDGGKGDDDSCFVCAYRTRKPVDDVGQGYVGGGGWKEGCLTSTLVGARRLNHANVNET